MVLQEISGRCQPILGHDILPEELTKQLLQRFNDSGLTKKGAQDGSLMTFPCFRSFHVDDKHELVEVLVTFRGTQFVATWLRFLKGSAEDARVDDWVKKVEGDVPSIAVYLAEQPLEALKLLDLTIMLLASESAAVTTFLQKARNPALTAAGVELIKSSGETPSQFAAALSHLKLVYSTEFVRNGQPVEVLRFVDVCTLEARSRPRGGAGAGRSSKKGAVRSSQKCAGCCTSAASSSSWPFKRKKRGEGS